MTDPCSLTASVTALANAIACRLNDDELALASAAFVQLGDTLTTIAAGRNHCNSEAKKSPCRQPE